MNTRLEGLFDPWGLSITMSESDEGSTFTLKRGGATILSTIPLSGEDAGAEAVLVTRLEALARTVSRLPNRGQYSDLVLYDIVKILP